MCYTREILIYSDLINAESIFASQFALFKRNSSDYLTGLGVLAEEFSKLSKNSSVNFVKLMSMERAKTLESEINFWSK